MKVSMVSMVRTEKRGAKWFLSWDAFSRKLREKGDLREDEEVVGVTISEKGIEFKTAQVEPEIEVID